MTTNKFRVPTCRWQPLPFQMRSSVAILWFQGPQPWAEHGKLMTKLNWLTIPKLGNWSIPAVPRSRFLGTSYPHHFYDNYTLSRPERWRWPLTRYFFLLARPNHARTLPGRSLSARQACYYFRSRMGDGLLII